MSFPLSYLVGSPSLDAMEIEDEMRADARVPFDGLPDDPELEREMSEAFKWDVPPTDAELEAMHREWLEDCRRNDEAAAVL